MNPSFKHLQESKSIEDLMRLLPSGIPQNDDTYARLRWHIISHQEQAKAWCNCPPDETTEKTIYLSFGCQPEVHPLP